MSVNDSSTIITFERNTIPLINTAKPDVDGYYEINAGAYGVFNESGIFYSAENIEKLFENNFNLLICLKNKDSRRNLKCFLQ